MQDILHTSHREARAALTTVPALITFKRATLRAKLVALARGLGTDLASARNVVSSTG